MKELGIKYTIRMKKYRSYNGEIISYDISSRPGLGQVIDMLDKAFAKIPDNTNLIFHSDQGWQYQHKKYQKRL